LIAIVIGLSALLAGLLSLQIAWQWPGYVVFTAIVATAVLNLLEIGNAGIDIGVNLYADDVAIVIILITCCMVSLKHRKPLPRDILPCFLLLLFILQSFIRGVVTYGSKPAGNSVRNLLAFVTPAFVIMVLRPAFQLDVARLARWLRWAGYLLSVVAVCRWAGVLPTPGDVLERGREVTRVIQSDYAFVVGLAFLASVYGLLVARRGAWAWVGAAVLGSVTFALQHRSVWTATAAGLVWLAIKSAPRVSPIKWLTIAATACILLGTIIFVAPQTADLADNIATVNARELQSKDSTWSWRVSGYESAVDRLLGSNVVDMYIGPPAGWAATSNESMASTHIHSRYVDTLAYYGIGGCTVLILWFGILVKRVWWVARSPREGVARNHAGAILLQAALLSELVYLIPYFGGILQGSILGLLWVAANQKAVSPRFGASRIRALSIRLQAKPATLVS
jgi:hypothetical protein